MKIDNLRGIVLDALSDPDNVVHEINQTLSSAADVANYVLEYCLTEKLDNLTDEEHEAVEDEVKNLVKEFRASHA